MFANLKIGARLSIGFGLVLAIVLLIGAVSLSSIQRFSADVVHLGSSEMQGAAHLADAQSALWQLRWDVAQFIAVSDPAERRKLADNGPVQRAIVEEKLRLFAQGEHSPEEREALRKLQHSFAQYTDARPKWFQLYGEGKLEEAADWRARTITAFGRETVQAFAELVKLQRENAAAVQADVESRMAGFRALLVALLSAALAVGALVAVVITRSITRPLGEAVAATQEVAGGNLAIEIHALTRDEPGRVLAALATMRDALAQAVDTIRQSAQEVGTASRQIAVGNTEMSGRTEQQASSLEETASSMEELTTTVRQNAENARRANELTIGASSVAEQGGKAMEDVVATMGGISEASRRISDIIGVIDGIAFQTNILALNAAVEAARAGEQGRGFAVVASEVRTLAQRSAEAAKEIKSLIQESVQRVDDGTRQVQDAGRTIGQVVASVKDVTGIMAEIATASREQLSGIEQVGNAVTEMDRVTQQNASLVQETAMAAENMQMRAEELLRAVGRFRLHADEAGWLGGIESPRAVDEAPAPIAPAAPAERLASTGVRRLAAVRA